MSLRQISALTLCLLTLGTGAAFAQVPELGAMDNLVAQRNGEGPGRRGGKENLMEQLNLSAEQKQRMAAIRNQYKDQIRQRSEALRQARNEMRALMEGTSSTAQIREKNQQIATLQQQLMNTRMEMMLAMREELTPEQRTRLAELMKQRQNQRPDRTGANRGNRGQGRAMPGPGGMGQ